MRVDYLCSYYGSWAAENVGPRSQALWDAYKFCRAVKNKQINGWCTIPMKSGDKRIDETNVGYARQAFGFFIRQVYREQGYGTAPLVPAPSKDSFSTRSFRSRTMIEEAKVTGLSVSVVPAVRFNADLQPSSQGGPRGFDAVYPHVEVVSSYNPRRVVLVDDIVTTGGMLLAAHDRLVEAGYEVLGAIACGRTTSAKERAFQPRHFELDHELGELDF